MKVKCKKEFHLWDLDSRTLEEIIFEFKNAFEGLDNAKLRLESCGYDGGFDAYVSFEREENERERSYREKEEAKLKAQLKKNAENLEAKERKEYERLRKKYE